MTIYFTLENDKKISRFNSVKKWFFLSDQYELFQILKNNIPKDIQLNNMAGEFANSYLDIELQLLREFQTLAKEKDEICWWAGQVASHVSTGSNIIRNTIYATFIIEIVKNNPTESILVICSDIGLLNCLRYYCKNNNITHKYKALLITTFKVLFHNFVRILANIGLFFLEFLKYKINIRTLSKPDLSNEKTVVIRTWLTGDTLSGDKKYKDRHFGHLSDYLVNKGCKPVILPQMFNTRVSVKKLFSQMEYVNIDFLIPHHLLGYKSCFEVIMYDFKRLLRSFNGIKVNDIDISSIFKHEIFKTSFDRNLLSCNLIYPLMNALQKINAKIECFIYPFENNAPEKLFIMAKQKFFPKSKLFGFQHTVIPPYQLGIKLAINEHKYHPLPDRIICSGAIWKDKLEKNNFPETLLKDGPSLRFVHIRNFYQDRVKQHQSEYNFFIALPYSQNLSFELIQKVHEASKSFNCTVRIKPHPLLNIDKLIKFIELIGDKNLKLVDGTPYSWFQKSDIAFEIGWSVTQMEAAAFGIPVIRIIPENYFHFDPMDWLDYPIPTSQKVSEIIKNINKAFLLSNSELKTISKIVIEGCFSEVNDQSMDIFL